MRHSHFPHDSVHDLPRFDFDLFVFDMSDLLAPLRLFVRVARTGSFSRAGRELAISQPSASRIIAALEREVGAPLLTRTTRAVSTDFEAAGGSSTPV